MSKARARSLLTLNLRWKVHLFWVQHKTPQMSKKYGIFVTLLSRQVTTCIINPCVLVCSSVSPWDETNVEKKQGILGNSTHYINIKTTRSSISFQKHSYSHAHHCWPENEGQCINYRFKTKMNFKYYSPKVSVIFMVLKPLDPILATSPNKISHFWKTRTTQCYVKCVLHIFQWLKCSKCQINCWEKIIFFKRTVPYEWIVYTNRFDYLNSNNKNQSKVYYTISPYPIG